MSFTANIRRRWLASDWRTRIWPKECQRLFFNLILLEDEVYYCDTFKHLLESCLILVEHFHVLTHAHLISFNRAISPLDQERPLLNIFLPLLSQLNNLVTVRANSEIVAIVKLFRDALLRFLDMLLCLLSQPWDFDSWLLFRLIEALPHVGQVHRHVMVYMVLKFRILLDGVF